MERKWFYVAGVKAPQGSCWTHIQVVLPEAIEAGMEKIRAMIEDIWQKRRDGIYLSDDDLRRARSRLDMALDCYAALGGNTDQWRDKETGVLK